MRTVYLNHANASYPKAPGVGAAMAACIDAFDPEGTAAAVLAEEAKEQLRALTGARSAQDVRFTPGGGWGLGHLLRSLLTPGAKVLLCCTDFKGHARRRHHDPAHSGSAVVRLTCDHGETAVLEALSRTLTHEFKCVVLPQACPVCGALFPLGEIGRLCRERDVLFLVDGSDTLGSIPVDMEQLHIDGLFFSGDKSLLGPPGIGGLVVTDALSERMLRPHAGQTNRNAASHRRRAPRNLPALYGLHAALRWRAEQDAQALRAREVKLTGHLLARMQELTYDGLLVPGPRSADERAAVVSIAFPKTAQDEAVARLASQGIYAALLPEGLPRPVEGRPDGGALIRMTPGPFLTFEDMDYVQGEVMKILYG